MTRLAGVLEDGRAVVMRNYDASGSRFEVVDKTGQTVTMLDVSTFAGTMTPQPDATTVRGNDAFVMFSRTLGQNPTEFVVFRLNASSQWLLVRRVSNVRGGFTQLALSDGTILVREQDPGDASQERIVAFSTAGSEIMVWREADATVVRTHGHYHLLVGPAVPSGPSVRTE
jgi:hypothetical protein